MQIRNGNELHLFGFVGDDWFGEGFTASQVITALAEIGSDQDVTVRLNSGGGYTDDGVQIYNALGMHQGKVTIRVEGIAASAASIIAMAGNECIMLEGTRMMIHDPWTATFGNEDIHNTSVKMLSSTANQMADIYARKTDGDASEIREEMRAELWMDANEAVSAGYATSAENAENIEFAAFAYGDYKRAPQELVALANDNSWAFTSARKLAAQSLAASINPKKEPSKMGKDKQKSNVPDGAGDNQLQADTGADAGDTATQERGRVKAILSCDHAKTQMKFAEYLAFDTDHSVEDAQAMLSKIAEDNASQSAAGENTGENADTTSFDQAVALSRQNNETPQQSSKPKLNARDIYKARQQAQKGA